MDSMYLTRSTKGGCYYSSHLVHLSVSQEIITIIQSQIFKNTVNLFLGQTSKVLLPQCAVSRSDIRRCYLVCYPGHFLHAVFLILSQHPVNSFNRKTENLNNFFSFSRPKITSQIVFSPFL